MQMIYTHEIYKRIKAFAEAQALNTKQALARLSGGEVTHWRTNVAHATVKRIDKKLTKAGF